MKGVGGSMGMIGGGEVGARRLVHTEKRGKVQSY